MKFLTVVCVVVAMSVASMAEAGCGGCHRGTRCGRRHAVRGHHCARGCAAAAPAACAGTCNAK